MKCGCSCFEVSTGLLAVGRVLTVSALFQVLDSLLDKSHCGYSPDWSLVETISELQMGERTLPQLQRYQHRDSRTCFRLNG